MTWDHLRSHAAKRPDAVAVLRDGRGISFAQLSADIARAGRALSALGLARGHMVAIGTKDLYLNWLLLLACERIGIGAAPFQTREEWCEPLMASVDLVLAEDGFDTPGARRKHRITADWTQALLASTPSEEEPPASRDPDDPVRLLRTSGTTRAPRQVLIRRRMHDGVLAEGIRHFGLNERSRFLQSLPITVRTAYDFGSGCLRAGGMLVLENRMTGLEAMVAHQPTHAIMLPFHLKGLLDGLSPEFSKPRALTILSLGAGVSASLRKKAMARLATALCELYGTVEAGAISSAWAEDEEGAGSLWPGAEFEAVDERDRALPPGQVGLVRVRTPWLCARYEDDPEATRRAFRGGWFYPGDAGSLRPDGKIKLLGRTDDLLNISGQKFHPADMEARLLRHEVAGDVGVSSVTGTDGIEEFAIAISDLSHQDAEIMARIHEALRPFQVGRFNVVKLERIPRSPSGKLQRQALREEIARRAPA